MHPNVKPFVIRVPALFFNELQGRLRSSIRNAYNVIVEQSVTDQFKDALAQIVNSNEPYRTSAEEPDTCVGCMDRPAVVRQAERLCLDL